MNNFFSIFRRWFQWAIQARWLWTNVQIATLQRYRRELLLSDRYLEEKRLNKFEFQVYSQNGEDGIISEIFNRIKVKNSTFVEIGVGDGLENNTAFLLQQGWNGYWLEGNKKAVRFITKHFNKSITKGQLHISYSFIRADNIRELLENLQVPQDVDLLSVDIDRNTYFILDAILTRFTPRVFVTEYSSLISPSVEWIVEYSSEKTWNRSTYAGASLKAYEILADKYGYSLVGCDLCGVNAFFVKDDFLGNHFLPPYTAENHYEPLRDYLSHRVGPPRQFTDLY